MQIVLFEDDEVALLAPATLGRPAFAISCGSRLLVDLVGELGVPVHALVRPHLQALVAADFPQLASVFSDISQVPAGPALWVDARLVPSVAALEQLRQLINCGQPGAISADAAATGNEHDVTVAAALVPSAPPSLAHLALTGSKFRASLPILSWPHDIVRAHLATLGDHLAARIASGRYREIAPGVFAAADVQLGQYVVTDTSAGPIVLEEGVTVGPFSLLSGPAHLGKNCRVIEHAAIKHGTALGHTTKIGGEVEESIIEPYTNKQHHGFLGHSYLGSWINLGAGTSNSDLKNTYGQVNMEYAGQRVETGMQFVGAIMGDYTKTAINTSIFTGKVVGVCSMLYGFVTTNVPSFVNYARGFGQVSEAPVEVLVATQKRMFARRGVEQRPCDIQLLHDMHALTAGDRERLGGPLTVEPLSL
jgi:UDP-N-acetylglucosamine diphosphorylase / glucose-1-phosphate thymidylyltransferase / UDP-N-acetylgalactosamine diphosphorylase / glucosamine-1-phosphate N-acetyltransferase / galactosamine-1-phosphate N-acetyltransferase